MTTEVSTMNTAVSLADRGYQGIGIPGLEHMPTSFIPVPRIKLVQSNTQSDSRRLGRPHCLSQSHSEHRAAARK